MPKYSGNNYELRIGRCKVSEDKGEYVVKAENSYGSREESALLDVERKMLEFPHSGYPTHNYQTFSQSGSSIPNFPDDFSAWQEMPLHLSHALPYFSLSRESVYSLSL